MTVPPRRARIYSPFLPFPFTEGSFPVIHDQARTLAEMGWEVELVTWKDSPPEISRKLRAPSPDSFSDQLRITSLPHPSLRGLRASEWLDREPDTTPAPRNESTAARAVRVGAALASRSASPEIFHYPPSADRRRELLPADLGIYHYSFAYPWLRTTPKRTEGRVVVHLHNLESELARIRVGDDRMARLGPASWIHRINTRKLASHERALHRYADEVWFLSARDLEIYFRRTGAANLRLVPPTLDPRLRDRRRTYFREERSHVNTVNAGFLGGCYFEPNRASLEWIIERLAPELRERGFSGTIPVAGRGVPDELRARARGYEFFEWLGFVPDLEAFWARLSFFLIPHVCGSGVRIKLLEALASGVPVLANQAAVDPLVPAQRDHPLLIVSDDPAEWAERIVRETAPFQTRSRTALVDLVESDLPGVVVYQFLSA